jgi:3-oxoacyl-(acyl-carrier-protein) synthase
MRGHELVVVSRAGWPGPGDRETPRIPGYVLSSFSPLVAEAADRCLRHVYGTPPAPLDAGRSTAVIVVSASGDLVSARHVARTVDSGNRVEPLFFFQCVPNSIAGHIAARWGLGGPVVCLCPTGHPLTDGLDQAALLIDDGDATAAVVVSVEQSGVDGVPATATAVVATAKETHVRQGKVADEHLRY